MLRGLAILLLVLFAAQQTGAFTALFGEHCIERCADDDDQGNCGADCQDCVCCGHGQQGSVSQPLVGLALMVGPSVTYPRLLPAPDGEAQSIFHVPRA